MKPQANRHNDASALPAFFKRNALFSALVGAFSFFPLAAHAAPWNGAVTTTANSSTPTVIGFGGQQWAVIGNDDGGVYTDQIGTTGTTAPTNSITLLLNEGSAGGGYGNSAFGTYPANPQQDSFSDNYWNYYNGSILQGVLEGITNSLGKEKDVINARDLAPITQNGGWYNSYSNYLTDLSTGDGINGTAANDQLLWALSYPEWYQLDGEVKKYSAASAWWLRSRVAAAAARLPGGLVAPAAATPRR
ncbi:MAG: hypothetical protein LBU43_00610 [Candidatus Accumulibacter sp.]|jgi:hypothetical protein|nr:hypothetical protein [Accumulibacter sp.]